MVWLDFAYQLLRIRRIKMKSCFLRPTRKTVWLQLLTYFILVSLITLAFSSGFLYSLFSNSFKKEVITLNDEILNQMSFASDEFILKNVNGLGLNISMYSNMNPDFKSFFNSPDENDWDSILGVRDSLDNLVFQNRDIVDSIYVYSKNKNLCISQKMMKYLDDNMEELPDYLDWIGEMGHQNKSVLYLKTRIISVHSNHRKKEDDIITIVCTYPISSTPKNAKGYVAVNIKEEAINNYLVDFNSTNLGYLLIIDDSGSIISHSDRSKLYDDLSHEDFIQRIISGEESSHFETVFDGIDCFIAHTESSYNKWHYVSMVPTTLLYQKNYFMRQRMFTISIIILLFILVLSGLLSRKVYSPLKTLLDKYATGFGNSKPSYTNEYQLLDSAFSNMSIKVNDLQETLDKNMSMIQGNVLKDLLQKKPYNSMGIEETLYELDIDFPNNYFTVAILTFNKDIVDSTSQTCIQSVKYSVIDFITTLALKDIFAYPVDMDSLSIAIIINSQDDDPNAIEHFIDTIEVYCYSNFSFYLIAGVGAIGYNISDLSRSYRDSEKALKYRFIYPKQNIFYFDNIALEHINLGSIPKEHIDELDRSIRLGNKDETKTILDNIYSTIFTEKLPYADVRDLTTSITKLYTQFIEDVEIDIEDLASKDIKSAFLTPQNIDEFFTAFSALLGITFDHVEAKKLNKNFRLVTDITEYINSNIYNDLSLNYIADTFNISPQYLSRIFKEEIGVNYIDYITDCKINEAKKLLTTSDLTISEISSKLCYSHATYFSRKFKEATGSTPSEYRSKQNKKTIATSFEPL